MTEDAPSPTSPEPPTPPSAAPDEPRVAPDEASASAPVRPAAESAGIASSAAASATTPAAPPPGTPEPAAEPPEDAVEVDGPVVSVWHLFRAALAILRNPIESAPRLAEELAGRPAALLGASCCVLMAVTAPLYRSANEDFIDGLVRYGFDTLIAAGGLLAFAFTLHMLRRYAFEQEQAEPGESLYLVGCFALFVAAASTLAWALEMVKLGFLGPLFVGIGKVMGLCTVYSALPSVTGLERRGALLTLGFAAGIANLVFARELGMGRFF